MADQKKEVLTELAKKFLEASVSTTESEIDFRFEDKSRVLPATEELTELLDEIDEKRINEELGFADSMEVDDFDRD